MKKLTTFKALVLVCLLSIGSMGVFALANNSCTKGVSKANNILKSALNKCSDSICFTEAVEKAVYV